MAKRSIVAGERQIIMTMLTGSLGFLLSQSACFVVGQSQIFLCSSDEIKASSVEGRDFALLDVQCLMYSGVGASWPMHFRAVLFRTMVSSASRLKTVLKVHDTFMTISINR